MLTSAAWELLVDPATLEIRGRLLGPRGATAELVLARGAGEPSRVEGLSMTDRSASWALPERSLSLDMALRGDELVVRIVSFREQRLDWPETGAGGGAAIVPESEGLYVPLDHPFWIEQLAGECRPLWGGQLPFWGIQSEEGTVAYLLPRELRSSLCWTRDQASSLSLTLRHEFLERDGRPPLELRMVPTSGSPIGPALAYRAELVEEGRLVGLGSKIAATPGAARLPGALHAYLWGDGRTPEAMRELHALGVERAFLVYDQDPRHETPVVEPETLRVARSLGFLVGPYDTLANVQDPRTADAPSSVFDFALYRHGGVLGEDGNRTPGFRGRGFQLSSEALRRADRGFLAQRVAGAVGMGANAYFLDVDAAGELHDDFDPKHAMTLAEDRRNRLARMGFVVDEGLVLGSESAAAWAAPVIHVSHGTLTPKSDLLWELLRDRERIGGYWPPERPRLYFQAVDAPRELITLTFDPRYRLPLFEAVFHDSLVATDFWEASLGKFRNVEVQRTQILFLYGVPPLWHLDRRTLREEGTHIATLYRFFSRLHRRVAREPLTRFEWLTSDRLVQRTTFGQVAAVTANFGAAPYEGLSPGCVDVSWSEGGREVFCPSLGDAAR